ncbi:hypothetical protein B0H11DRAFT_1363837 [Mycena galericulata]|nr:hypothetical protein B0H11DRAFT_1363837 [Mycena galericulata]
MAFASGSGQGYGRYYAYADVENCRASYQELDTASEYTTTGSAASPVHSHSPAPAPPHHHHHACPHPLPRITAQDFVHMNDTFIATDLPEDSPFALVSTDSGGVSLADHPYPASHQWPQTFKITEVKQIGPKKQTLACFFCRSRKIACAPMPVDGTAEDRSCEQCERRGIECKYPKESKRGQHNRIRARIA